LGGVRFEASHVTELIFKELRSISVEKKVVIDPTYTDHSSVFLCESCFRNFGPPIFRACVEARKKFWGLPRKNRRGWSSSLPNFSGCKVFGLPIFCPGWDAEKSREGLPPLKKPGGGKKRAGRS
jgi:hypothetical protein